MASDAFATFRAQRGRLVAWCCAGVAVIGFGVLGLLLAASGYQGWTWGDSTLLIAFGVIVAVVMWRFAEVRAVPSEAGIVVQNALLRRELRWDEIAAVRFGGGQAWAWLDLVDGDDYAVMAIQRADGEHGRDEAARLAALVLSRGGTNHRAPAADDLGDGSS